MQVLITFIGNKDPYANEKKELGPILSILKKRRFEKLYLLFNNDNYWDEMIETQDYCNQNYPNMKVEFREARSLDPTNYNLVYPAMYQVVENLKKDNQKNELTISVTSGTPTMHACWLFLVFGGVIDAKLIQISKQSGITEITFRLDDYPSIIKTDSIKAELSRLSRENKILKQNLNLKSSVENGFYIPQSGIDLENDIVIGYYRGALKITNNNAAEAAKLLKMKPHTFRKRLRKLRSIGVKI